MTDTSWALFALFLAVLLALAKPIGLWLAAVGEGRLPGPLARAEAAALRALRVPVEEMDWKAYAFGTLAFSAIGLLVASRAKTIEAVSGLTNLVLLPMWVLSGVFFSAKRFPDAIQPFIHALPLTALNDALRASLLQGTRLWDLGAELGILAAWLVVCFTLAMKLFRWR